MAKLFYSLEETASKLGKTPDEVKAMAEKKQLEVFRDRDRMMFKVDQVDLLAGGEAETSLSMADSGLEPLSLASSGTGTGMALESPKEKTGVSIFDVEGTEEGDSAAVTRVAPSIDPSAGRDDSAGLSGSNLIDLTKEIDETSLGGSLADDVYSATGGERSKAGTGAAPSLGGSAAGASGLFESAPGAGLDDLASPAPLVAATVEVYDGPWSGILGGLAVGIICSMLLGVVAVILGMASAGSSTSAGTVAMLGENLYVLLGVMLLLTAACAGVGWVLGKKSA